MTPYSVWPTPFGDYDNTEETLTKVDGFVVIAPDGEHVCYCHDEAAANRIATLLTRRG